LDGVQFAALDLVQNGLAGAPQPLSRLVKRQVAVGNVGHEPRAELVGQPNPPRRVRGGLLAWEQPCAQPPVDRGGGDAELRGGLLDREQVAVGIGRWRGGDPVLLPDVLDAGLVERQVGAGASALLVEC
jgi:hypothetical protein